MALIFMHYALQKKQDKAPWGLLFLSALALGGIGIWSMHFIGMLAYGVDNLYYDGLLTIASFVVAVAVVFAGLYIIGFGKFNFLKLFAAGILVGLGVASMHYLGMAAIRADITYNPLFVQISIAIAIGAATIALWLAINVNRVWQIALSALVMGIAVCGMHYTAMAAATLTNQQVNVLTLLDNMTIASVIAILDTCFLALMGMLIWVFRDQPQQYDPSKPIVV